MRLWHEDIISKLPRQQLLGQHRECCALRGNGWNRKHSTVDYVFTHHWYLLYTYHQKVMNEMKNRGYHPNILWENPIYRGQNCKPWENLDDEIDGTIIKMMSNRHPIYKEHNSEYLKECLENLENKGVIIIL